MLILICVLVGLALDDFEKAIVAKIVDHVKKQNEIESSDADRMRLDFLDQNHVLVLALSTIVREERLTIRVAIDRMIKMSEDARHG